MDRTGPYMSLCVSLDRSGPLCDRTGPYASLSVSLDHSGPYSTLLYCTLLSLSIWTVLDRTGLYMSLSPRLSASLDHTGPTPTVIFYVSAKFQVSPSIQVATRLTVVNLMSQGPTTGEIYI